MKKRVFALFTAMFLLCGMLAGCGPTGSSSTTTDGSDDGAKDTLIVAIPESPTYMDPMVQASIGTYRVTTQMFDRLVMMDNDMNLVPGLAESWEVIDDTTTVFHLRQGVKFHNGEEMTSEDVKYSLERCIANPGVNYNYLIIESITCDDDYTVTIKTSAPFNALLYRLSLDAASIICKSADTSAEEFNKNPVGTGPFKFVSWELGGDVVLEAFEDYWGGAPAVKRVIFRTIPEALNRTIGLETGEVDLAYDLGITDLESLADNASVTTLTSPSTTVWYVGMNVQKAPFDNEKVRQAVAYALDTLQERGRLFVAPGDDCYEGMIVGESAKEGDMVVNVAKTKNLGNQRSSTSDISVQLTPPRTFTLEEALEYITDDELVEITPQNVRMRKRLLSAVDRKKAAKK